MSQLLSEFIGLGLQHRASTLQKELLNLIEYIQPRLSEATRNENIGENLLSERPLTQGMNGANLTTDQLAAVARARSAEKNRTGATMVDLAGTGQARQPQPVHLETPLWEMKYLSPH